MIVRNDAIALFTWSQYDKPYDPPILKVSLHCNVIDVPGFQFVGPLNDKLCVAYSELMLVVRPINAMSSSFFICLFFLGFCSFRLWFVVLGGLFKENLSWLFVGLFFFLNPPPASDLEGFSGPSLHRVPTANSC